jgi:hypothetical protein
MLCVLSFKALQRFQRRALRFGVWRRLTDYERAFFTASILYAEVRGWIVNGKIVDMILYIVEKLRTGIGARVVRAGLRRATELRAFYAEKGVFKWCPRLVGWLLDPGYVIYLGTSWMNTPAMFRSC